MRFVLLAALPSLLQAQADPHLLEALATQMKATPVLHVDFAQVRTVAALSRPLKASGRMVLSRDQGVIWCLQKPLALTYVVGPKGVLEIDAQGRRTRKGAREVPVVAQMGSIFQSLLQGRWAALDPYFTLQASGRPEQWEVTLLPKGQTATFLKRIQLAGGRTLDRIQVQEAGGDRMDLAFSHTRMDQPISEADRRLLAFE